MTLCSKCNEKIGFLEKKEYIENQIVCTDCYRQYQDELNRKKLEIEAREQKEEEEIRRKEKEKYQKMSIQELIRNLGNPNENEKRMAMRELGKREDVVAVNAVWEALNLEEGFDFDWRWEIYLDSLPIIGRLGGDGALNEMIKMRESLKNTHELAESNLDCISDAIDGYNNNPDPAPEATEAYNECINNLDFSKDISQKSQTTLDALDDAIKKLKMKKFEKMAGRIEANLDGISWQEFEDTILDALEGERNAARVGDKGIDGFTKDGTPIQIKQSQNIGRNVVDNFETAIRRYFSNDEKNKRGMIVAFSFTKGAYDEIIRAKDEDSLDIQLITADELDIKVKK